MELTPEQEKIIDDTLQALIRQQQDEKRLLDEMQRIVEQEQPGK